MLLGIREIKKGYPYVDNKDIDMVMEIHKLEPQIQYVVVRDKPRAQKVRSKIDIERVFGPMVSKKDYY